MASTVLTITHGSESQASIIDEFEVANTTPQEGVAALIRFLSGVACGARQGKIAINVDGGAATATWKFGVS
jgi:hypothetical protein